MKPQHWSHLPTTFLETLVREVDLEYDPYESSREEAIASVLNGSWSDKNYALMTQYWSSISEESFQRAVKLHLLWLSDQMTQMAKLIP